MLAVARLPFGTLSDGASVSAVELKNDGGTLARIIDYGATLQALETPDVNGKIDGITLGYDSIVGYEADLPYFGTTIGRYANRIAEGRFVLDGRAHQLTQNEGTNSLHGGTKGFDRRLWSIESFAADEMSSRVTMTRVSHDGEEGYPGELIVHVTFALTQTNHLIITYRATTNKTTIVNLTNHAHYNLSGVTSGRSAMDNRLLLASDTYLPVAGDMIPTGEIRSVAGSPFDFRELRTVGKHIRDTRDTQIDLAQGIDHNFVIRGGVTEKPKLAATLDDPISGRQMDILTTEPGLQVYSGNYLDGTTKGHGGLLMHRGDGIALEAQKFPDSPNRPEFPSTRLDPGHIYTQVTVLQLSLALPVRHLDEQADLSIKA